MNETAENATTNCFVTPKALLACSNELCSEGAVGPLCGACDDNWYISTSARVCTECTTENYFESMLVLLVLAIVGISLYMLIQAGGVYVPRPLQLRYNIPKRVQLPLVGALMRVDNGAFKVIWVTLQIILSIGWSLDVEYPEPFNSWLVMPQFMQLNFLSMDCLDNSDFHTTVYVQSAFPVILVIGVWTSYFVGALVDCEMTPEKRKESFAHHMQVFLLITYLTLPAVSTTQFNALLCVRLDHNEQSYLKMDTSIDCNGETHKQFIVHDLLMIAFYQMIPLAWIWVLCKHRSNITLSHLSHLSEESVIALRDKDDSLDPMRFLFNDYRPRAYFYEVIDM